MLSTTLHSILGRSVARPEVASLPRGEKTEEGRTNSPCTRARCHRGRRPSSPNCHCLALEEGQKGGGKTGGGGRGAAPPQIFRSVQSAQTDDRDWKCSGKTAGKMEILDIVDSGRHCFVTARLCEQNLSSIFRPRCNQFPKHWLAKSWRI